MGKLLYEALTGEIIGAAMEVHRKLGHGFLEAVYENALAHELTLRNIQFERQKQLPVVYKGAEVGHYIADIIVEEVVILELKALSKGLTKEHYAQIINYLVATGIKVGLLLNLVNHLWNTNALPVPKTVANLRNLRQRKQIKIQKNPRNPRQKGKKNGCDTIFWGKNQTE